MAVAVVLGLTACGGGNDERTTGAAPEAVASGGSSANLPARLDDVSLRLRQHGFDVKATSARQPQTPPALWPEGGLRVKTRHGPLTFYAYRSPRVVKEVVNPRRDYSLAFPGYRTQWSAGPAADQLGGCGRYLYYGRDATTSRALRAADLCRGFRTQFIIQA